MVWKATCFNYLPRTKYMNQWEKVFFLWDFNKIDRVNYPQKVSWRNKRCALVFYYSWWSFRCCEQRTTCLHSLGRRWFSDSWGSTGIDRFKNWCCNIAIKDCLIQLSLPIAQHRGQAYEGASNMSGHLNGVAAKIQSEVPNALFILLCSLYKSSFTSYWMSECSYSWFGHWSYTDTHQRALHYSKVYRLSWVAKLPSNHIKPLRQTRWTVRTGAFNSVLTNYTALCQALETVNTECHDEYGRRAGGCLSQLEKLSTYFSLKLSYLVFLCNWTNLNRKRYYSSGGSWTGPTLPGKTAIW